jgi:hypothetical protein
MELTFSRFFLCPETGGKTLEQVDYLFTKGALAFKAADMDDEEGSGSGREKQETSDVEVQRVH